MKTSRCLKMTASFILALSLAFPSFSLMEEQIAGVDKYFSVNLQSLSDDELKEAAAAVAAEQRKRIKTRIVLDMEEITLVVGKTAKINGTVLDLPEGEKNPQLIWNTSDLSVASVKNGQIKAVSKGETYISCSAMLSDGTTIVSECKITVIIPITSVSVDKKAIDLSVGDYYTPIISIKPENASDPNVVFETADSNIATVDENGEIAGIATGKTTITVKATDGSDKSATITVNVKYDKYMENTLGEDLFNKVIYGEGASGRVEGGTDDWYDRGADIGGISFEVHSYGKYGRIVSIEVLDIMNTGEKEIFYKVLDNLFIGDDLKKANEWVKKNLGKTTQIKIGDAYIILQQTATKAPIMYIQDEDHKDWV